MISNWQKNGSLRRYAETSYWLHKDGAVLRRRSFGFVYAKPRVYRNEYTYVIKNGVSVHVMMMVAFRKYVEGLVVMHLDNDKENNSLSNLQMGTNEENADGKAVQITIQHADGTEVATTYRSEHEAARRVGIHQPTINDNRKRQRPDSPLEFSTTKRGIKFAATDPPPPRTG
jgi:Tfp pilus assembly major pilin PilA